MTLESKGPGGYLESVLKALHVPVESQVVILEARLGQADAVASEAKRLGGHVEARHGNLVQVRAPESTVRDLSSWVRFQLGEGAFQGKRLLRASILRETHTPVAVVPPPTGPLAEETRKLNVGLGISVQQLVDGVRKETDTASAQAREEISLATVVMLGRGVATLIGSDQFTSGTSCGP